MSIVALAENYGHRTIINYDQNGKIFYTTRPLTLDDFLEPEEGDVYMQGELHHKDVSKLDSIFRYHLKEQKNITIYSDLKIIWGIAGLDNPAPDISIVKDVVNVEEPRSIFEVKKEGTSPFFVLEVVSPRYRDADIYRKPTIYRRAGVSEYVIVDSGLEDKHISYSMIGYRLIGNKYTRIAEHDGFIYSQTMGLYIGINKSKNRFVIQDGQTREEILPAAKALEQLEIQVKQEVKAREMADMRADSAEEELRQLKAKFGISGNL